MTRNKGPRGKTGKAGHIGKPGLRGVQGQRGETGPRGMMGLRGPRGPRLEHAEVLAVVDSELGEIRKHFVVQIARTGQMQQRLDEIHALLKILIDRPGFDPERARANDVAPKKADDV